MREFYIKDIANNIVFRGIQPKNEIDCQPLDYYKYSHAELMFVLYKDILKHNCPLSIPDDFIRNFVLTKTEELIDNMLASTALKPEISSLLSDNNLSFKQQKRLLTGMTFSSSDILWLNKCAQDLGYLLDVYHEEKYPFKFDEKQKPIVINLRDDNIMESIGKTNMSEGEMRALLEQRTVLQARIYHKDSHWHCFYFTYKGLAGHERGRMGAQPHYHYLSDRSGISIEKLLDAIEKCEMPTSSVHVIIQQ